MTERRVLALINPKSGLVRSFPAMRKAMDRAWERPGIDLAYQFSQSVEDGVAKARRAVAGGVDTILVAGGDGTVNTIGGALIGTPVKLGVIPMGSGNGFARHFNIPLPPARAVAALADADVHAIDVGFADARPFFVTCSMAWDASIAESFARMPVRGILPYVFAGVQQLLEYEPQSIEVVIDGAKRQRFPDPMVFTVANLTQYGGGAKIAPLARGDDGQLELVVALRQDAPILIANVHRIFNGTAYRIPEVVNHRFRRMEVRRERPTPIQMDGELVEAGKDVRFRVEPGALRVLVPRLGRE
jgi:diacylglycerol kinase family enzyme